LPLRLSLFSFAFPGSPATGQRHKAREQASQAEQADTLAANCHFSSLGSLSSFAFFHQICVFILCCLMIEHSRLATQIFKF